MVRGEGRVCQEAHPEGDRLPADQHDPPLVAQWVAQAQNTAHLLVAQRRLLSHRRALAERPGCQNVRPSEAREGRKDLVLTDKATRRLAP
jgi:hypothetical protein